MTEPRDTYTSEIGPLGATLRGSILGAPAAGLLAFLMCAFFLAVVLYAQLGKWEEELATGDILILFSGLFILFAYFLGTTIAALPFAVAGGGLIGLILWRSAGRRKTPYAFGSLVGAGVGFVATLLPLASVALIGSNQGAWPPLGIPETLWFWLLGVYGTIAGAVHGPVMVRWLAKLRRRPGERGEPTPGASGVGPLDAAHRARVNQRGVALSIVGISLLVLIWLCVYIVIFIVL